MVMDSPRSAWLVLIISLIFTSAGLAMAVTTDVIAGTVCALFFGACALVALITLTKSSPELLLWTSLLMGVACLLALLGGSKVWARLRRSHDSPISPIAAAISFGVGALFFGGGGLVALIITYVGKWRRHQERRRHHQGYWHQGY